MLQCNKETLALKIGLRDALVVARIINKLRNLEDAYVKKNDLPEKGFTEMFPTPALMDFRIPKRKSVDTYGNSNMTLVSRSPLTQPRFHEKRMKLNDDSGEGDDGNDNNNYLEYSESLSDDNDEILTIR